ncbi:MAG: (2Fe-2S) ferredoxin domain-containing protein [Rhodospirillales bacterium]
MSDSKPTLYICTNQRHGGQRSCGGSGSERLLFRLQDELGGEVRIEQKKCMGYCRFGPVMKIVGGELFMNVTRGQISEIAEKARNAEPGGEED